MSEEKSKKKTVLFAGILAAGLLAAVFAAGPLVVPQSATAQDNNQTDTQQPVTSADDIDCATDPSLVHCAEDADLISAPIDSDRATLSTSGSATTKTQPDKFTVTVGVETDGATAQEAASLNANMTAAVIAALQELGITEEQMSTSSYSVYPVYGNNSTDQVCIEIYPPPPGCGQTEITDYKASNSISVTLETDGELGAGEVTDAAIEAGANNVSSAYFFLSQEKQQEVRDSLIADAIADARHRADAAADALGMQVSGIHSVTLNDVQFPVFYSTPEALQADTQILPGEQEVTSTVNITYFIGDAADEGEDAADEGQDET